MRHRSEPKPEGDEESTKTKEVPSIEEEAEEGAYRLPGGQLYLPGSALREALITACKGYTIKVSGISKEQPLWKVMAASVFLPQSELPLFREGEPIMDYEIDLRRVVVGKAGVVRARPIIRLPWEVEAIIEYDAGQWPSTGMIVEMLNNAGRFPGLLEFRPERGGTFGRFEAASTEADQKAAGKVAAAV
jgi:hypothetical protein